MPIRSLLMSLTLALCLPAYPCAKKVEKAADGITAEQEALLWFARTQDSDVGVGGLGVIQVINEINQYFGADLLAHCKALGLRGRGLWEAYRYFAGRDIHKLGPAILTQNPEMLDRAKKAMREAIPDFEFTKAPLEPLVTVENGEKIPKLLVTLTNLRIQALLEAPGPVAGLPNVRTTTAVYELKERVLNPDHEYFGVTQQILFEVGLIRQDGSVPDYVQNILRPN